jgi:hypothetical protein
MTYSLEVGWEGNVSDPSHDHKMRVATTYSLEVEREGTALDCSCDHK